MVSALLFYSVKGQRAEHQSVLPWIGDRLIIRSITQPVKPLSDNGDQLWMHSGREATAHSVSFCSPVLFYVAPGSWRNIVPFHCVLYQLYMLEMTRKSHLTCLELETINRRLVIMCVTCS